ncbi:unnamed protein product [Closterium sp. NIES-54]
MALRLASIAASRVSTALSVNQVGPSASAASFGRVAHVPLVTPETATWRGVGTISSLSSILSGTADSGDSVSLSPVDATRVARLRGVRSRSLATIRDGSATAREVSLVQGASRGIGLELVRQLLQRNPDSHVIATCRNPAAAAALQELQSRSGDRLTVLPLDVTDEATIEEAARHVSATWGHLNLLINASGLLHMPGAMKPGAR